MLTFVWAEDQNRVMGLDGDIPWHLPADMKFFVDVTMTGNMLMGRKTFDSFPNGALPKRENIVVTRSDDYQPEGAVVFNDLDEAIEYGESLGEPLHCIGGANLFEQLVDRVDRLYRTVIYEDFPGDTYFPDIDYDQFELTSEEEGPVDEKNKYKHVYQIWDRKK